MRQMGEAMVEYKRGSEKKSRQLLDDLIGKNAADSSYQIAEVYAFRGEKDKAFEWLQRALRMRDDSMDTIKYDVLLRNLRDDPRYAALLKQLSLPQ